MALNGIEWQSLPMVAEQHCISPYQSGIVFDT